MSISGEYLPTLRKGLLSETNLKNRSRFAKEVVHKFNANTLWTEIKFYFKADKVFFINPTRLTRQGHWERVSGECQQRASMNIVPKKAERPGILERLYPSL